MSRRTQNQEHIRSIQKTSTSHYITLPVGFMRKLGWKTRQKVSVSEERGRLIIRDWKP